MRRPPSIIEERDSETTVVKGKSTETTPNHFDDNRFGTQPSRKYGAYIETVEKMLKDIRSKHGELGLPSHRSSGVNKKKTIYGVLIYIMRSRDERYQKGKAIPKIRERQLKGMEY